jgi:hypothetical protein
MPEQILALVRSIRAALADGANAEYVAGLAWNLAHLQMDAAWRFAQGPGIRRRKAVSATNRRSARQPRAPRLSDEDRQRILTLARQPDMTDRRIALRMARAASGDETPTPKEIEKWRGRVRLATKNSGS